MNYKPLVFNVIARQYNERWRFPVYDRAIKKLQCQHVHSFLPYIPPVLEGPSLDYDVPVYVCKFSPSKLNSDVLAIANENGTVCLEKTSGKKMRTYVQTHNNTVFDLAWMPGEKQFVTVSGDHSAKLWDCGESDVKMISEFLGHTRSVKCVHFKPENTSVFATGSRDGSLILWDARCSRKCSTLPISHLPDQVIHSAVGTSPYISKRKCFPVETSQSNSVTGLIFQNDNTLISSGSSDQCIRVWDMRRTYSKSVAVPIPKYQLYAPSTGFSHLCIDPSGTKIYANSMDSYIYCFNVNTYHPDPISAFYGHRNGSFYVKSSLSHDGHYLLSGSSDKLAYIWSTKNAELSELAVKPIVKLPGHSAEVACVVMSLIGDIKVATCSDDGTYRLWYNFNIENIMDREEVIHSAEYLDSDWPDSVRTQWKNKRKRSITDDIYLETKKGFPCSFHSKICRYYDNNLSTISCMCQRHCNYSNQKRPLDHYGVETEIEILKKRRSQYELQETTPPRSTNANTITRGVVNDLKSPKKSNASTKTSLKRKLSDLSHFADDIECKRKAGERVLVPVNADIANHSTCVLKVTSETQDTQFENAQFSQCTETENDEFSEGHDEKFSSPTTNLPNYVKDGTSPYIHRCPKNQKENMDWLTKLRKNSVKKLDIDKSEDVEGPPKTNSKCEGRVIQVLPAKRKMSRSGSFEGKKQTLHKYFKISNKSTDITHTSQDIHKKTC